MIHRSQRNFKIPTQFEREQFNETDLYTYSDGGSPLYLKRDEIPLGVSASDPASHLPDVPPISERETPIGKGVSTESIHSYKEKWHTLAHLAKSQELITDSHGKDRILEKNYQEDPVRHEEKQKPKQKRKKAKQKDEEEEQLLQKQQQHQQQLQEPQSENEKHILAQQQQERQKQFSQSAQLVRQQIEVANKLRALSAQGSHAFGNTDSRDGNVSRENINHFETTAVSQVNRQVMKYINHIFLNNIMNFQYKLSC
jgi:uncharacterized membrane-anchored protein YhcB (DUF1043 family)